MKYPSFIDVFPEDQQFCHLGPTVWDKYVLIGKTQLSDIIVIAI